jgi:hypothetical protein
LGLLFNDDGFGPAFRSGLAHLVFQMLRDGIDLDGGFEFIFIIFEHFRTQFIAVPVTHALLSNRHFHKIPP